MIAETEGSDTDSENDVNEIEGMLYSQIHHSSEIFSGDEITVDRSIKDTSRCDEILNVSALRKDSCRRLRTQGAVELLGVTTEISSVNKENVQCTVSEPVIVLSSDDECEILDYCGVVSKYSYHGAVGKGSNIDVSLGGSKSKHVQPERSPLVSASITSQKSRSTCVANLYMHIDGGAAQIVTEEIDVGSDLDVVSISSSDDVVENTSKRKRSEVFPSMRKRQNTANDTSQPSKEDEDGIVEIPVPVRKGDDWFVCDGDRFKKRPDRRSDFYRQKLDIICHNCSRRGHITKTCPEPMKKIRCYVCGDAGHHGDRCYRATCSVCWETGHSSISCPQRKKIPYKNCNVCQVPGHLDEHCPDFWRRYHLTIELGCNVVTATPKLKSRNDISCCNCGRQGHFVHECNGKRMDVFVRPNRPDVVKHKGLLPAPSVSELPMQSESSYKIFGKCKKWKRNLQHETRQALSFAKQKFGKHLRFTNNWNRRKPSLNRNSGNNAEQSKNSRQEDSITSTPKPKKKRFWIKTKTPNGQKTIKWRNSKRGRVDS